MRICQLIILLAFARTISASELECLAKNIYYEARSEPEAGQFMVGFITHNRVHDSRWPNTYCKVVYQPNQFMWVDKVKGKPADKKVYNKIKEIAKIVIDSPETKQYGFYYKRSDYKSFFFRKLTKLFTIANHEFYK